MTGFDEADKVDPALGPKGLLDQIGDAIRLKHYSPDQAYVDWVKRYILSHKKQHPKSKGATQVKAFLEHFAIDLHVTSSTQNQALNALVFLYREIILQDSATWVTFFAPTDPNVCPLFSLSPK